MILYEKTMNSLSDFPWITVSIELFKLKSSTEMPGMRSLTRSAIFNQDVDPPSCMYVPYFRVSRSAATSFATLPGEVKARISFPVLGILVVCVLMLVGQASGTSGRLAVFGRH